MCNKIVSIVMPAYNSGQYIEAAINSVINQLYKNWELIVVNDASTDNTLEIIKRYEKIDSRIKTIDNLVNKGVSYSRSIAIEKSSGTWIAFLDSDDIWKNDKLKKQIECAINNDIFFIFTGASYINKYGISYKGIFEIPLIVTYDSLKYNNVISCSSVLIKKEIVQDVSIERDDIHEDFALWLTILSKGIIAYGINEPLLIYRISNTSKSGNKLKTIIMTFKTYRYIKINIIGSILFTFTHSVKGLIKYKKIYF